MQPEHFFPVSFLIQLVLLGQSSSVLTGYVFKKLFRGGSYQNHYIAEISLK